MGDFNSLEVVVVSGVDANRIFPAVKAFLKGDHKDGLIYDDFEAMADEIVQNYPGDINHLILVNMLTIEITFHPTPPSQVKYFDLK